jgi:hypothetical protein
MSGTKTLNRWCPIQEDVEAYFRETLPKVLSPVYALIVHTMHYHGFAVSGFVVRRMLIWPVHVCEYARRKRKSALSALEFLCCHLPCYSTPYVFFANIDLFSGAP